jgi:hypothetical protein
MDSLEQAVAGVTRRDLLIDSTKGARIEIRASEAEKEEIRAVAEGLGISVGEYLLRLHRFAKVHLKPSV